jgi:hypothetical protein
VTRQVLIALLLVPATARAEEPWRITVPDAVDAEVDAAAAVSLAIAARDGHTISRTGPVQIDLHAEPPAALTLPRRRLHRRDAADAQADAPRFDLRFKARVEGDHALRATIRFWVCGKRTCRPVKSGASVLIRARKPAPPPAPTPPRTP